MQCQEYVLIKFPGFNNSYGIDVLGFLWQCGCLVNSRGARTEVKRCCTPCQVYATTSALNYIW
jgi:hypothetical protein